MEWCQWWGLGLTLRFLLCESGVWLLALLGDSLKWYILRALKTFRCCKDEGEEGIRVEVYYY